MEATNTQAGQKPRKKAGRKPRAANATLTRRELSLNINKKLPAGTKCSAAMILDIEQLTIECMADAMLQGRNFEFRDFGVFTTSMHKARVGRDPHHPDVTYAVPGHRVVRFRAGQLLRDKVAKHQ